MRIERFYFDEIFAVAEDSAGVTEHIGEVVHMVHVLEGAGPVFCDEEVVAVGETEAFANVFEAVTEGPADADGFFGEGEDLFLCFMERVFGFDPVDLVEGEVGGERGIMVQFQTR